MNIMSYFKNKVSGDENVLFTGDIEVSHMQKVESALDIKLHKQYLLSLL